MRPARSYRPPRKTWLKLRTCIAQEHINTPGKFRLFYFSFDALFIVIQILTQTLIISRLASKPPPLGSPVFWTDKRKGGEVCRRQCSYTLSAQMPWISSTPSSSKKKATRRNWTLYWRNSNSTGIVPKRNLTYERHSFFTRSQESGETIDQFVTGLRTLAKTCEFDVLCESLIKDRLVCGISDDQQHKSQAVENPGLDVGSGNKLLQSK